MRGKQGPKESLECQTDSSFLPILQLYFTRKPHLVFHVKSFQMFRRVVMFCVVLGKKWPARNIQMK